MSILIFEHSDTTNAERLAITLNDYGHRLKIVKLHHRGMVGGGDLVPPDLDDVDGIISCGGPQAAYDDSIDWLEPQMALMRQAHAMDMPIVGLCLGCQLLARALGGTVEKNPAGLEFGWHDVSLTPVGREDMIHTGIGWTTTLFHHHRDHISKLPPMGRLLASSAQCKVQAWTAGLRSYGFQHHPEVTVDTIERWCAKEPETLEEAGIALEELRDQTRQYAAAFERVTERLFESIALLLMPVDRRYGLARDLIH